MDRIAVIIPCYNEAQTIGAVIQSYKKALPKATVYVYDNNSSDSTGEIAKRNGAVVRKEPHQGKGCVIRRMFREIDAECYLMVDGDDTYPADVAYEMCQIVLNGDADMVVGDRLSTSYFQENKRPMHGFGNRLIRWIVNCLFKSRLNDVTSGMRCFSYAFVKTIPILAEGFDVEIEMTLHALDKRFVIKEIPIQYRDRPQGSVSKLKTVSDGALVLKTIFALFRDYRPFLFF